MPKRHGARPADTGYHDDTPQTYKDLEISKLQASRWQKTASISESDFEALIVVDLPDDEAYMVLATSNSQDEMSPLEYGLHALHFAEKGKCGAGRGNEGGISEYARTIGKARQNVATARDASEYQYISECS